MALVWRQGEISVREACDELGSAVAYTTVMTTMDRLFKKGCWRGAKSGARSCTATASRDEIEGAVATELVHSLLQRESGEPLPVLSSLVDAVSERDRALLDELERLIREKRRRETRALRAARRDAGARVVLRDERRAVGGRGRARAQRPRRRAAARARLRFWLRLRLLPSAASPLFVVVALVFVPSYWKFEPREFAEGFDLTLTLAAAAAGALLVHALVRGARRVGARRGARARLDANGGAARARRSASPPSGSRRSSRSWRSSGSCARGCS